MKTIFFLLAVVCLPIFVWGQENKMIRDTSATIEVIPPEFTGIKNAALLFNNNNSVAFEKYMTDNFVYPDEALKCFNQGTIVVQFVVNENGDLTDFNIINSVCPEIDKEFIEVIKTTDGMWKPGFNNGKPFPMEKEASMMIVVSLTDKDLMAPLEYFTKMARSHFTKANTLFLEKHNLKKALRHYDQTIKFLPYDASSLLERGLCRYTLGDLEGARSDWERINRIGSFDVSNLMDEMTSLKGYNEMMAIIEK